MLSLLLDKRLLMPLIIFIIVFAAIEISFYRGHAAGTAKEKERQGKVIQELKDKTISEYLIKTSKKFKRDESIGQLELRFEKETERQKNAI